MKLKIDFKKRYKMSDYVNVSMLITFLLTMLLLILLANCAYSSTGSPTNKIVFEYVPQGYSTPSTGYWMDEPTGRNMLYMVRTYREQAQHWEDAHKAVTSEFKEYIDRTNERLINIEAGIEAERDAWKKTIRRAKAPGVGAFAGAGYGSHGDLQAVVGIGLVWKIW